MNVADILHVGEAIQACYGCDVRCVRVLVGTRPAVVVNDNLEVDVRVGADAGGQGVPGTRRGIDV